MAGTLAYRIRAPGKLAGWRAAQVWTRSCCQLPRPRKSSIQGQPVWGDLCPLLRCISCSAKNWEWHFTSCQALLSPGDSRPSIGLASGSRRWEITASPLGRPMLVVDFCLDAINVPFSARVHCSKGAADAVTELCSECRATTEQVQVPSHPPQRALLVAKV